MKKLTQKWITLFFRSCFLSAFPFCMSELNIFFPFLDTETRLIRHSPLGLVKISSEIMINHILSEKTRKTSTQQVESVHVRYLQDLEE